MKKQQSNFVIFLLIVGVACAIVLAAGIMGMQHLGTQKDAKLQEFHIKNAECVKIEDQLKKRVKWQQDLQDLDAKLSTLDKRLVDYEYIPTYLEQIQEAATDTKNIIRSIRPRPIASLDSKSPLIVASYERWLAENEDVAAAAKEKSATTTGAAVVETTSVNTSTSAKKPSEYRMQQFTLEIEGNYASITRFLNVLRTFPKLIYVHSVSVAPLKRGDATTLRAVLETYAIIPADHYQPDTQVSAVTPAEGKMP